MNILITKFLCFIDKTDKIQEDTGASTSWTNEYNGEEVTVTLKDINNYLDAENVPVIEIDPKSVESLLIDVERDPNRVDNADLSYHIIVSKINGEYNRILDGQHRIVKSIKNGIPTIKARILDLDTSPDLYKFMFK